MGSIPPNLPPGGNYPIGPSTQPVQPPPALFVDMEAMRNHYLQLVQAYDKNPSSANLKSLTQYMEKMQAFIADHLNEIYNQTSQNGFPPGGQPWDANPTGFVYGFQQAVTSFTQDPTSYSLNMANESFTQLSWLVGNERTVQ